MIDPAKPLSTRDVLERARAAARAGAVKGGKSAQPLRVAAPAPAGTGRRRQPAKPGLLSALRLPSFGKPALRRGSTLRTALIASATAAALSVFFASWAIFAEGGGDGEPTTRLQTARLVETAPAGVSTPRVASLTLEPISTAAAAPTVGQDGAALYNAALGRIESGEAATAVADIRRAAELGHAPAQLHLASLYEAGSRGVAKNPAEARRWTTLAAEGGDRRAMHNLGLLHFEGGGGPKDLAMARQWFRRAADLGLADSQYNLGLIHERGYGVSRNPAEAYKWFIISARSGDAEARTAALRLERTLSPQAKAAAESSALAFRPGGLKPASAVAAVASPEVATAQRALSRLGYYKGPTDGRSSPALREAVLAWQRAAGAPADGVIDAEVIAGLSKPG
jgi:localization factor PodJL